MFAKDEGEKIQDLVYGEFGFMSLVALFKKHRALLPPSVRRRCKLHLILKAPPGFQTLIVKSDDGAFKLKPGGFSSAHCCATYTPGGVCYDLGSGVGRPVFAAALLHPFARCVGIEILTAGE